MPRWIDTLAVSSIPACFTEAGYLAVNGQTTLLMMTASAQMMSDMIVGTRACRACSYAPGDRGELEQCRGKRPSSTRTVAAYCSPRRKHDSSDRALIELPAIGL
ncbi:MAG: hypothetical protein OXC93_12455 [Rhodospirillaceae bacterium]|nr:hypothetical protein [Rhodospirillaceae bacterium]